MSDPDPRPLGWKKWILGARPRTLPAAIAPVLVGSAAAAGHRSARAVTNAYIAGSGEAFIYSRSGSGVSIPTEFRGVRIWVFFCALGVALFVQIATNYANDYSDGIRGVDDPGARVGPMRLVGNGLAEPGQVKAAMLISFAITALFGLPLVLFVDWRLVFVGIAAIAAGWFYTGGGRPYGYAGFGEVFVFVFFGLVATVGSFYVQSLDISWLAIGCGISMGCLATALLVVNNLRDIPGDTAVGKRTLAVRLGDRNTRVLYVALLVLPMFMVPLLAGLGGRPLAAIALLAVVPARQPLTQVLGGAKAAGLIPVLGRTGQTQVLYAVLLSVGLFIGGG